VASSLFLSAAIPDSSSKATYKKALLLVYIFGSFKKRKKIFT